MAGKVAESLPRSYILRIKGNHLALKISQFKARVRKHNQQLVESHASFCSRLYVVIPLKCLHFSSYMIAHLLRHQFLRVWIDSLYTLKSNSKFISTTFVIYFLWVLTKLSLSILISKSSLVSLSVPYCFLVFLSVLSIP